MGGLYQRLEDCFSELADYYKSVTVFLRATTETTLAQWVGRQRFQYKLHLEGKRVVYDSVSRDCSLGIEWNTNLPPGRPLKELADYQKATGTAMSLQVQSENTELGTWVRNQKASIQVASKRKEIICTP
jgi:hypothetical protein